jgi:hypothetical protein
MSRIEPGVNGLTKGMDRPRLNLVATRERCGTGCSFASC